MNFFYEMRGSDIQFGKVGRLTFGSHLHIEIEIAYINSGSTSCFIDGTEYSVGAGDAVIILPNRIHSYSDAENIKGYILIFDPAIYPELMSYIKNKRLVSPIIRKEELDAIRFKDAADFLYNEFINGDEISKKGCGMIIAGKLFSLCRFEDDFSVESRTLLKLINFCQKNYKENITVEDIAKALNISKGYVSHIFSKKLQIGFSNYVNSLRINEAVNLLADTENRITEISYKCGFSTLRTFNRVFFKSMGMSPREYRKKILNH